MPHSKNQHVINQEAEKPNRRGKRRRRWKVLLFYTKKFVPIKKPNAQKNGPLVQMKEEMKNTSPNFKEKPRMEKRTAQKWVP